MLEATILVEVKARLVCGFRASLWGWDLFCGCLVVFRLLDFSFCLSFLVFLMYISCVCRALYAFY
jgi:hypothetical protein